jgi:hypothetical protein
MSWPVALALFYGSGLTWWLIRHALAKSSL